ncbi:MAG: hypothetical protein B7733_00440 [Myxococcales bacterium FL481]|nr:MAG: hypothetical protein B7733_00440 [Myxococcales bacterium FL481]
MMKVRDQIVAETDEPFHLVLVDQHSIETTQKQTPEFMQWMREVDLDLPHLEWPTSQGHGGSAHPYMWDWEMVADDGYLSMITLVDERNEIVETFDFDFDESDAMAVAISDWVLDSM